jgi:hypothetical protein
MKLEWQDGMTQKRVQSASVIAATGMSALRWPTRKSGVERVRELEAADKSIVPILVAPHACFHQFQR